MKNVEIKFKDETLEKEVKLPENNVDCSDIKHDGSLENEIVIPSGRHDGKGTRLIVIYRAGRNPI